MCYILEQLKEQFQSSLFLICGSYGCTIMNMILTGEKHEGLRTKFLFRCNMCNVEIEIGSESTNKGYSDVNRAAVLGIHAIGRTGAALTEFYSNVGLHWMNERVYEPLSVEIHQHFVELFTKQITQNGIEEVRISREMDSIVDGIPT